MSVYSQLQAWFDKFFAEEESLSIVVILGLVFVTLAVFGEFIAPILASVVISFLLEGLVRPISKLGVSRKWSVSIVYLLFVGLMAGFFLVLLPELWRQLTALIALSPQIFESIHAELLKLSQSYPEYVSIDQFDELLSGVSGEMGKLTQQLFAVSLSGFQGLVVAMIYLVLVPIVVFFLMRDADDIMAWFGGFMPARRERLQKIWAEFIAQCGNYARGKAIEILIVGVTSYICFTVLGLSYAGLLGLLVGISVIIPYLGAAVVTIPVMMVAYFQFGFSRDLLIVFIAYQVIQFLDGNVLVPLLFSEAVSIHPVAIIAAVLIFGGLWGLWGVFFAIPLATLIKALINSWATQDVKEMSPSDNK